MNLILISGEVTDLNVTKGYENMVFTARQSTLVGMGAIAAAAAGEGLSATTMGRASQDAEIPMEFFTCTVDNKVVSGRFLKVEFTNGQQIDFVVDHHAALNDV